MTVQKDSTHYTTQDLLFGHFLCAMYYYITCIIQHVCLLKLKLKANKILLQLCLYVKPNYLN